MSKESEYLSNLTLRKKVTLSIVLLYIFVGLPVWYHLTKVDQYDIRPLLQQQKPNIEYLFSGDTFTDIDLKIPIFLNTSATEFKFPDLLPSVQKEIDTLTKTYKEEYGGIGLNLEINELGDGNNTNDNFVVQLEYTDHVGNSISLYEKLELTVQYDDKIVFDNGLPYIIAISIVNNFFYKKNEEFLANELDRTLKFMDNSVEYKPKTILNFNLVVNDNILSDWDINYLNNGLYDELINPFVKLFNNVYDFKIESNIFYNEDLNLSELDGDIADVQAKLDYTRLSDNINFINKDMENVINFALVLTDKPKESTISSYNIPEWGSIFIYNDTIEDLVNKNNLLYVNEELLEPLVYSFIQKAFERLTSSKDSSKVMDDINSFIIKGILSNIDRTNKNIKAIYDMVYTLPVYTDESLNELIPEELQPYVGEFMSRVFPSLSIPKKIYEQLKEIVEKRDLLINELEYNSNFDFKKYLKESFEVYDLSEKTFFDHEMVMGGFKSIKHIIAVYLPLLGPMCSIAIGGFIKLVKKPKQDPLLVIKTKRE
ncbi:GPI-anchor transamidase [Hanseniaspora uvarum]|nr:GPI-anchor transamidase [Hanseniaspora uvarum]